MDGSGNPIANAEVYLWREDLAGVGGVVANTTADSNGNFLFAEHPDGTNSQQSWHVAAEDPNGDVQLHSAYGVTASPFPTPGIRKIGWNANGDTETGFSQFVFADTDKRADSVKSLGFGSN